MSAQRRSAAVASVDDPAVQSHVLLDAGGSREFDARRWLALPQLDKVTSLHLAVGGDLTQIEAIEPYSASRLAGARHRVLPAPPTQPERV